MTEVTQTPESSGEGAVIEPPPVKKNNKKRNLIIAGSVAAALIIGAGVGIPLSINASNKAEYTTLSQDVQKLNTQIATNEASVEAGNELIGLDIPSAQAFAKSLNGWAGASAVSLKKDHAAALGEAGKALDAELKGIEAQSDGKKLEKAAKDSKVDLPASHLDWTIDQAGEALGTLPVKKSKAPDTGDYTKDKLDARIKEVSGLEKDLKNSKDELKPTVDDLDKINAAVNATRPALVSAAESLPSMVDGLKSGFAKGGDIKPVKDAADNAAKLAKDKNSTPAQIHAAIASYFDAANARSAAHNKAVDAERAAAQQAAVDSGAGGYTDPATGEWTDSGSYDDSDWTGGDSGWGGGGSSGGSGGGGSSGGSGGGGGGSTGGGNSGGGSSVTPESWFEANCPWGYNWSSGSGGYCFPEPEVDFPDEW